MDLKKGSIFLLKIGSNRYVPVCIVGKFDENYMTLIGEVLKSDKANQKVNCYFGQKNLDKNIDLINSTSWGDKKYNGVKYNTYLIPICLLSDNLRNLEEIEMENFYPRGSKMTIKKFGEIDEVLKEQERQILNCEKEWGYETGYFDLFANYKQDN